MSAPLLELRELRVHFARGPRPWFGKPRATFAAVDGVSLTIERGAAVGVVGESGSGKSTLARALVGLARPSSGAVLLEGVDLASLSGGEARRARARVQMLHQDPYASLDPRRTVLESVVEPLAIHGRHSRRERKLRALALLDAVGLDPLRAARFPHEFSGGQRQRIALARALVLEPELLVLDEPTSALDVSVQAQIVALLGELRRRFGLATLFISHDLALVRHVCDEVHVMLAGRVVERAPCEALFERPRHPYTRLLLACAPLGDPERDRTRPLPVLASGAGARPRDGEGCPFRQRCPDRASVEGERCATERPELVAEPGDARRAESGPGVLAVDLAGARRRDHAAACHALGGAARAQR